MAGYALLVEAYVGLGSDLRTAVEKVNVALGLAEEVAPVEAVPTPADNDLALAELQRATAGLKRRK